MKGGKPCITVSRCLLTSGRLAWQVKESKDWARDKSDLEGVCLLVDDLMRATPWVWSYFGNYGSELFIMIFNVITFDIVFII